MALSIFPLNPEAFLVRQTPFGYCCFVINNNQFLIFFYSILTCFSQDAFEGIIKLPE
jgi:hypothetical protein